MTNEQLKILHIEDDEADVELLAESLHQDTNFFCKITVEHDLEGAARRLRTGKYDIVLIDLGLGATRGIETYRHFKELNVQVPVIIVTGLDDEEVGLQAISEGAQDYLVKGRLNSSGVVQSIKYARERFKIEQKLAEQEMQYRSIFETVTDALLIHDTAGKILEVNPAATDIYGYSREELLTLTIFDLVHPDSHVSLINSIGNIKGNAIYHGESLDIRKDGKLINTVITSRRLIFQGKEQILGVVHDVTELKKIEEELRKHRDKLEEQVKERTAELEDKYLELAKDYQLMIGRELRIKELREEIKSLKAEQGKE
ncbi:MAG: PAS domain S-box protein [Candidatus Cloacimonetes bacterium]|nr:PAS domain S-box protein [Candidatus Cloacimonadota bacterium]